MKTRNLALLLFVVRLLYSSVNAQIVHNPGIVTFQNTESARPAGTPADFHLIYWLGSPLVGTQYKAEHLLFEYHHVQLDADTRDDLLV
jgi:hypothetical protein